MAYMDQEKKAIIANNLKPILKKYNIKATMSVRNNSTFVLTLKSGVIDFISNYNEKSKEKYGHEDNICRDSYMDVNPYWYQEHFTDEAKSFLDEVTAAIKSADWFDKSDIMTDYFHTAFYYDIKVGNWDKPYQVTNN